MVRADANDPGLAAERTALAWQRSGLSLAAIGAVIAKGVPASGVSNRPVVGLIAVAVGLALMVVASSFEHRRRRQPVRPIATWLDLATLAIPTTVAGIVLVVVVAWPA